MSTEIYLSNLFLPILSGWFLVFCSSVLFLVHFIFGSGRSVACFSQHWLWIISYNWSKHFDYEVWHTIKCTIWRLRWNWDLLGVFVYLFRFDIDQQPIGTMSVFLWWNWVIYGLYLEINLLYLIWMRRHVCLLLFLLIIIIVLPFFVFLIK